MNDNDIIKALECCAKSRNTEVYCHECPYRDVGYCLDEMMSEAILLVNRQKAEIEALIAGQETLQKNLPKVIRTEAIREFAEKLCKDRVSNDPVVIAVKVELEEMAGEYDV